MKLQNLAAISTLFASAYAVSVDPASVQDSTSRSLEKRVNPITYFRCPGNQFYPVAYINQVMEKARNEFMQCNVRCLSKYPKAFTTCSATEDQFFRKNNRQGEIYYRYPIFRDRFIFNNVEGAKPDSEFIVFNNQGQFAGVVQKKICKGSCAGTPQCVTRERNFAPNFPLIPCEPIIGELPQPQQGQSQPGQSQPGQSQPGQSQPGQSQQGQPQFHRPQFHQPQQGPPQFRQTRGSFKSML